MVQSNFFSIFFLLPLCHPQQTIFFTQNVSVKNNFDFFAFLFKFVRVRLYLFTIEMRSLLKDRLETLHVSKKN